jgi:hypothetical protein
MRRLSPGRMALVVGSLLLTAVALALADANPRSAFERDAADSSPAFKIDATDIARWPPRSAERAFMKWFSAVQDNRAAEVIARTDPAAVASAKPSRVRRAVRIAAPVVGMPVIVRTLSASRTTRLRVVVPRRGAQTSPRPSGELTTFVLEKTPSGGWVLADLSFLMRFATA